MRKRKQLLRIVAHHCAQRFCDRKPYTKHNKNGIILKDFIAGKHQGYLPPDIHLHNLNTMAEWTHATPDGKWVQIDLIISNSTIKDKISTMYEDAWISDHRGISVRVPAIFPEYQQQSQAAYIPDWKTFNHWNFNLLTEINFTELAETGKWHTMNMQEKIRTFTTSQQEAFRGAILYKQKSLRGNTKPRHIVELIKVFS